MTVEKLITREDLNLDDYYTSIAKTREAYNTELNELRRKYAKKLVNAVLNLN